MKKELITAAGAAVLGAALLCTGSVFAPIECRAEDTVQTGLVLEVEESTDDILSAGVSGTFGENRGLYWQFNEATNTIIITGEDYLERQYRGMFDGSSAEHVVFKNCRIIEANFSYFFDGMTQLKDIDFSGLEVGKIKGVRYMFCGCNSLERLDLSWMDLSGSYDYSSMFYNCSSLDYLDISSFDIDPTKFLDDYRAEVTDDAFYGCKSLKIIKAPKYIRPGITFDLPKTFDDETHSGNWYTSLSSINTGMTLKSRDCDGWSINDNNYYWYEDGVRQGREGRGKEIYDPDSDAWYWLDAVQNGAKAVSKDVYQESSGGKWVRYDADGHMVKGWDEAENGMYYFDPITGAMTKGIREIDGVSWLFDEATGIAYDNAWVIEGDKYYWYEKGFKQGTEGRGKEIYDAKSDGWYWLDAIQGGAKAVSKDVYQESSGGKWVRYDADGHMVKGWQSTNGGTYYFDRITGAMAKGWTTIGGSVYYFDEATGLQQQ